MLTGQDDRIIANNGRQAEEEHVEIQIEPVSMLATLLEDSKRQKSKKSCLLSALFLITSCPSATRCQDRLPEASIDKAI